MSVDDSPFYKQTLDADCPIGDIKNEYIWLSSLIKDGNKIKQESKDIRGNSTKSLRVIFPNAYYVNNNIISIHFNSRQIFDGLKEYYDKLYGETKLL